jgi:DNA (cytosine-5)-methyltransferase 1
MRHGSLFSGIGGFDLASEWMGWENVFHCEWMEFPRKVLDYYWPNADSHINICKTDFTKYANKIDILTGGFPCQPFSMAGKRKGTDDERYLWGEMLRAIQEIKPTYVIAENVFGITNIDGGMVFEQVCVDLEAEGYEVQPFIIPAAAKNAPHRRDRCWFIGVRNATDTNGIRYRGGNIQPRTNKFQEWKMDKNLEQHRNGVWCKVKGCSGDAPDASSNGRNDKSTEENNAIGENNKQSRTQRKRTSKGFGDERTPSNSNGNGFKQRNGNDEINASKRRINAFGNANKIPSDWEKFPTQSPICGGNDGLPTELDGITFPKWRAESIKGYGNAIVPQVALELFKVIESINFTL